MTTQLRFLRKSYMALVEMSAYQKVTSIHAPFFEKYLVLKAVTVIAGYFTRICYVDYL